MKGISRTTALIACGVCLWLSATSGAAGEQTGYRLSELKVACAADAPALTTTAANELRRYVYLLTGTLPDLITQPGTGACVVMRTGAHAKVSQDGPDAAQNFALYREGDVQVVHGASPASSLWAAYNLIESWGVGFYLGSDAIPPVNAARSAAFVDVTAQPALTIRGSLPWFNFMNSPTTWNPQDYKTFFAQMAKQRANFIGFHVYDHEPFCGYDFSTLNTGTYLARPKVTESGGPLMTTISPQRWWSPAAMSTSEFLFGTDLFFDRGEWGCEIGIDDAWAYNPARAAQLQQRMMADALHYAQTLGIKTCIGFEATGNPGDAATRAAFEKRMSHVLATYPLDYFWLWQSEGRGTAGTARNSVAGAPNDASIKAGDEIAQAFAYLGANHDLREAARIVDYVRLAHQILQSRAPRVRLVVSGWGGDAWMRFSSLYEGLDKVVPPDVIFSALDNIDPRLQDHVAEAYGKVQSKRERWPIPWFESDGGYARCDQTGPQTNVTGFEPLLKDTIKKGCQGALGIHWRTRNIEDVAGYLYRFAWNPQLTAAEFLKQYASDHYGADDAEYMAKVHLQLEEFGPQYVGAVGCIECSTPFTWFVNPAGAEKGREPNRAGHLPDESRLPKLDKLATDLMERSKQAQSAGRVHAATQYHDLSQTITWLVIRAKVGLAIWNDQAPLAKQLVEAERLFEAGDTKEAAKQAEQLLLSGLKPLDFERGLTALASTCRTRGELGMLATANSRYGRFYAAFLSRVGRVMGVEIDHNASSWRGSGKWKAEPMVTLLPVPGWVELGTRVNFDAIVLPQTQEPLGLAIEILSSKPGEKSERLPMNLSLDRIGGAYYRLALDTPAPRLYAWSLIRESEPDRVIERGILRVTAKARRY